MIRFYFSATQFGSPAQQPRCATVSMPASLRSMSMFMQ